MKISEKVKNYFKNFKFTLDVALKLIAFLVFIAYVVIMAFGNKWFQPMNTFWRSLNIFGTAAEFDVAIRVISYIIFFLGASWAVRLVLKIFAYPLKRGKAIVDILCSLIKYAAVIVMVFFILKTFNVDTTAILAGIGILGLIVGLGAQPLIADIIAGLFIVFEKVFDVGDIIVVDGFRGTVKDIGIRTTRIEDTGGNIKIINNADLKTIINMTNQLSLAVCEIGIEYGESLERVEAILKANMDAVKEAIPDIKEGPFYKGVAALGESSVVIRFVANCEEDARYQVERDMNRQFKLIFDKNNINIPFPQVVVNQPISFRDATKHEEKESKEFVEEQKKLSKGIADGDLNNV
ncbi:MAG: mechanosensitive ion channel family protein [Clostridia bacterium]|nr:mechanosensitive ion channel family protein [Clostridia bacterium]